MTATPPSYTPPTVDIPVGESEVMPPRSRKVKRRRRRFDVISAFGELLMTAGVIVGMFAFWQVFVTDWQVAGDTRADLQAFVDEYGQSPDQVSKDIRKTAPPAIGEVQEGHTFATLHVPRWDYMVIPVKQGVQAWNVLDLGAAGHYPQTQMPNELGNFAVAAHRRSYGSNFRRVEELKAGDPIVLETKNAWIVYKLKSTEIVTPDRGQVLLPVPNEPGVAPTGRQMTMTTCHPEYGNSHRFIVHTVFDHWVPRNSGIPAELAQGGK